MAGNNSHNAETELTLGLLKAVHDDDSLTQRAAARDLGIALGLVNTYLKRCIKKGFIKVKQAPSNRYAYYLTPKGFAEKSRLTAEYLSVSLNLFRDTRSQFTDLFETCTHKGWRRIVLAGAGDMVEIAIMCMEGYPLELLGFVDRNAADETFAGFPVRGFIAEFGDIDAVIVADLSDPQGAYEAILAEFSPDRILFPPMLNVTPASVSSRKGDAR